MAFEPNQYISSGLQVFAEIWADDFADFYGLDRETPPNHLDQGVWRVRKILHEIAKGFLDAAMTLQPSQVKVERVLEYFEEKGIEDPRGIRFIQQDIEVLLARNIGDTVAGWRDRALEMIDVLIEVRSERSRAYLLRLARCYVYGMQPEAAVMARAVLDAALQDLLDDDEIFKAGNAKHARRIDLDDRLRHLQRQQLISRESWEAADRVRQSGNDAIHLAPGAAAGLRETLRDLKLVFHEIDQSEE